MIGERERELVDEVLRSGQLSLGPMGPRFERAWAERIGVRHAVAVSSGTAGLHLCLHALGIGPGDEVVTSSFSFVASANAVLFTGATPVFAEVDPLTFNMDPAAVEAAITPRTRAILIVDIFGYPAEVPALVAIAERHGLGRVEDACQTIDGAHDGRKLGTFGHPAVYGFYANKQLTTAEGGDRPDRRRRARAHAGEPAQPGPLRRRRLARPLAPGLQLPALGRPLRHRGRPARAARRHDGRPRPGRRLVPGAGARDRRRHPDVRGPPAPLVVRLRARGSTPTSPATRSSATSTPLGVSAKPYLPCIHLQPYYRDVHGHRPGELPVTEAISASTIALPFFPEMTEDQVDRVCAALARVIRARRRAPGSAAAAPGLVGQAMSDGARLWGGRFAAGPAEAFDRLNSSLDVDRRLWPQDLAASRAHARMLAAQGIISGDDADAIASGLARIEDELRGGDFAFRDSDEDIHTAVERRLTELVGRRRPAPAHRPQPQRPGHHRRPALPA